MHSGRFRVVHNVCKCPGVEPCPLLVDGRKDHQHVEQEVVEKEILPADW